MVNSKAVKPAPKFWATTNFGGYGCGQYIAEAVANANKGNYARKKKLEPGLVVMVWPMDPAKPLTHVLNDSGHAVHAPAVGDRSINVMDKREYCYALDDTGFPMHREFHYRNRQTSEAGRHFVEVEVKRPAADAA